MTKKISFLLLIVTLLGLTFSLTSCEATSNGVEGFLTSILPDENSSKIAQTAHNIVDWIATKIKTFLNSIGLKRRGLGLMTFLVWLINSSKQKQLST
ncbi:MAG: hypothetical protein IKA84_01875 [Clostridia bacterium]|nr:hypothetical protein [Clostridia bacterium]